MRTSVILVALGSACCLAAAVTLVGRARREQRETEAPTAAPADDLRVAHDDLLQELSAATYALDADRPEEARAHVARALADARQLASKPFRGQRVDPGMLVPPS